MGDPVPHRPGAEHCYLLDLRISCASRQLPTSAYIADVTNVHQIPQRRHRVVDLLLRVVEVRRHADAGAGTVVDDHPAADQFVGDRAAVRDVDDDRPAALAVVCRRVEPVAGGLRRVDQPARQRAATARGSPARRSRRRSRSRRAPNTATARSACRSGNARGRRRSGSARPRTRTACVRGPADDAPARAAPPGPAARRDIRRPGPPHSHFTEPPTAKSASSRSSVHRHRAGPLVHVEDDVRADAVRLLDDRRGSVMQALLNSTSDSGTSTVRSSIASRNRCEVEAHRIRRRHVDDLRAVAAEALEQVEVRRELEVAHHDLAARAVEGEARRDDRHARP